VLSTMEQDNPEIRPLLDEAAGYVVFPKVGEGGLFVGGGAGIGVLFERGQPTGFAQVFHASVGALAGGQRYSELVIVRDREMVTKMRSGEIDFGANASAVILRSGVAANATFRKGLAVFIKPVRGAMVNASITGQRIKVTF
jgi:lipid-binding SYLF domain-containing protein